MRPLVHFGRLRFTISLVECQAKCQVLPQIGDLAFAVFRTRHSSSLPD